MVSRGLWQVLCSLGRNRRGLRSLNTLESKKCLPKAAFSTLFIGNWRSRNPPLRPYTSRRKNLPLTWSLQIPPTLEMPGDHFGRRQPKWTFLRSAWAPASSSSLHMFPHFICSPIFKIWLW